MNHEYFFEVPATKGFQGGREQYLITAPMTILRRLLALDDGSDVMERSQRELNRTRARKISRYIGDAIDTHQPYFLPALCGNINASLEFIPTPAHPNIGILRIPMDSDVKLFDGQTRSFGIMDLLRNKEIDPNESIALVLTVNLDLRTRQQFFSDVNDNASKPPAAISMAYNATNAVNQLAMHISRSIPDLAQFVDYEHNVVPASSPLLVSFKALTDATRKMLGLRPNDRVTDEHKAIAVALWSAWARRLQWAEMLMDDAVVEYRKTNIGLHGVMINAIGIATGELMATRNSELVSELISSANLSIYEDFSHEQWNGICVDSLTGAVQSSSRAQQLAAAKIVEILPPQEEVQDAAEESINTWFVPLLPTGFEASRLPKLKADLETVMAENTLNEQTMARAITELVETECEENILKTLTNIRFMRKWSKSIV
ncbi:DGQHR domain-containing protein [Escherichia coli]